MPALTRRSLLSGAAAMTLASALPRHVVAKTGTSISPETFGAAGDGVTDDHAAWTRALELSAQTGGTVTPTTERVYKIGKPLVVGPGMTVDGPPGASTIMAPGGKGGIGFFMSEGDFSLGGLRIVNNPQYHIQHEAAGGVLSNVRLSGLHLKDGSIGINTFAYGMDNHSVEITGCVFEDVDNPLYFSALSRSRIHGNRYSRASGANIMLSSGQDNVFENEAIDGGRTGIVFLPAFSKTKFLTGTCQGNVIANNTLTNINEEFISFDQGNNTADISARETRPIAATRAGGREFEIRLEGDWGDIAGYYSRSFICIVTGALAGKVFPVSKADGGTLLLVRGKTLSDAMFAQLKPGDIVTMGLPFLGNTIRDNRLSGETGFDQTYPMGYATGIYLYNFCYENRVTGNVVNLRRSTDGDLCRGISIRSSNGIDRSGSIASKGGRGLMTPSCNNLIENNEVSGADIVLDFHDYGARESYVSNGNRVQGNRVSGGRILISGHQKLERDNKVSG